MSDAPIPMLDALLADPSRAQALLGDGPARARTGFAVASFIAGLRCLGDDADATRALVAALVAPAQPFAWEGVGLAAAARGRARFDGLRRALVEHAHLLSVGAGWAAALRGEPIPVLREDPDPDPRLALARWSELDGHGFCLGLLRRRAGLAELGPEHAGGPVELALDQGLGRSLYFVHGGAPGPIIAAIEAAPTRRRGALWSGVGVASVFTDGLDEASRAQLRERGGRDLLLGERLAAWALASITGPAGDGEGPQIDPTLPPLLSLRGLRRRAWP